MTRTLLGICAGIGLVIALFFLPRLSAGEERVASDPKSAGEVSRPPGSDAVRRAAIASHETEAAALAGLMPAGVKSVLAVTKTLKHGDFVWDDQGIPQGPVHVWVDLRRQTISVFRAGHEIGSSIIVYGAHEKQTPLGTFEILSKHRHYRSRSYDAEMPYTLFITTDGVALHSSVLQPRHATHGCVGLPDEFARRLFELADVGAVVDITRSDPEIIERFVKRS